MNFNPPPAYASVAPTTRKVRKKVEIKIPRGVRPGNTITVNLPNNRQVKITVPKGMKAGNTLTVKYEDEVPVQYQPPPSQRVANVPSYVPATYVPLPTYVPVPTAPVPTAPVPTAPVMPPVMPQVTGSYVGPSSTTSGGAQFVDRNKGGRTLPRTIGAVGRETYMYSMQDSTARDEELAWKLANEDWAADKALQIRLAKEEQILKQKQREQEEADAAYARNLQSQFSSEYQQQQRQRQEQQRQERQRQERLEQQRQQQQIQQQRLYEQRQEQYRRDEEMARNLQRSWQ
jgi:hypothetical protein